MALSVSWSSWNEVLSTIVWYAPFEFFALLLSATAGLMPMFAVVKSLLFIRGETRKLIPLYFGQLADSLKLFFVAVAVLLIAAVTETIVITIKGV